jgi:hypothetical protein
MPLSQSDVWQRRDAICQGRPGSRNGLKSLRCQARCYECQRIFDARREDYVSVVPFVEDEHTLFLKTTPNRKAPKQNLGEESNDETRC